MDITKEEFISGMMPMLKLKDYLELELEEYEKISIDKIQDKLEKEIL